MNNYKYGIKAIKGFLKTNNDDEGLRTYFLNAFSVCKVKVDNRNKLYWVDKSTYYRVDFLFAKDDNEKDFWINNINNYSYLYVFALLSKWSEEFCEERILKKRNEEFLESFAVKIDEDVDRFKMSRDTLPHTTITELGFFVDTYSWSKHASVPVFPEPSNYEKYFELFRLSLENRKVCEISESIAVFVNFCKAVDIVAKQNLCIVALIEKLFSSEIKTKTDIIKKVKSVNPQNDSYKECYIKIIEELTELIINEGHYEGSIVGPAKPSEVFGSSESILGDEESCNQHCIGDSYWARLTVNGTVGSIKKIISDEELLPIQGKICSIHWGNETNKEDIHVRLDIYIGQDENSLKIVESEEKNFHVSLKTSDILLFAFKSSSVWVDAILTVSIDELGMFGYKVDWQTKRHRFTRDWVDTIKPSSDGEYDYTFDPMYTGGY